MRGLRGLSYADRSGGADGVTKVGIKAGAEGRGLVQLQARGSSAGWPEAFSAELFFAQRQTNTADRFKAKTR